MKKAFFAGLTVLLALVMVTCDVFPPSGAFTPSPKGQSTESNITYDAEGNKMIEFNIPTPKRPNGGRALSGDIAQSYAVYYEVAFKYGAEVFRATWLEGQTGRIRVYPGTYDLIAPGTTSGSTGSAVMFAGTRDGVLLGVGKITAINGAATTTYLINEDTRSVTFTLIPLTNDVKADPTSSFKITTSGYLTSGLTAATFPKATLKEGSVTVAENVPLFNVAKDDSNTATYTVGIPNQLGVIPAVSTEWKIYSKAIHTVFPTNPVSDGFRVTGGTITGTLAASTTFALTFTVPDKAGCSWLALDIPVYAMVDDSASVTPPPIAVKWHIKGGIRNYFNEYDMGVDVDSLGGGILLGSEITSDTVIIDISTRP